MSLSENEALSMRKLGDIRQLGYVVRDLNASITAWSNRMGVGPWTVFRNVTLQCDYRGQHSEPVLDVGLSYRGTMQIELIQQKDKSSSPYRRMLDAGFSGLHHTAYLCEDIDGGVERTQAAGFELACDIRMPDGARYAYMQSDDLGDDIYVELLEYTDTMKTLFREGVAAAEAWTGDMEITEIDMRHAFDP